MQDYIKGLAHNVTEITAKSALQEFNHIPV